MTTARHTRDSQTEIYSISPTVALRDDPRLSDWRPPEQPEGIRVGKGGGARPNKSTQ